MQQQLKISLKILILLLVLLSKGGEFLYASTISEVKQEQPVSSEKLTAVTPFSIAVQDPHQGYPDLSNNLFFGSSLVIPSGFHLREGNRLKVSDFSFRRDLRRSLEIQLFPKHFFL